MLRKQASRTNIFLVYLRDTKETFNREGGTYFGELLSVIGANGKCTMKVTSFKAPCKWGFTTYCETHSGGWVCCYLILSLNHKENEDSQVVQKTHLHHHTEWYISLLCKYPAGHTRLRFREMLKMQVSQKFQSPASKKVKKIISSAGKNRRGGRAFEMPRILVVLAMLRTNLYGVTIPKANRDRRVLRLQPILQYRHGLLYWFGTHVKYSFPHTTCHGSPQNRPLHVTSSTLCLKPEWIQTAHRSFQTWQTLTFYTWPARDG